MKKEDLLKLLDYCTDEDQIQIKSSSGMEWEIIQIESPEEKRKIIRIK